jgi:hypothetical protein
MIFVDNNAWIKVGCSNLQHHRIIGRVSAVIGHVSAFVEHFLTLMCPCLSVRRTAIMVVLGIDGKRDDMP